MVICIRRWHFSIGSADDGELEDCGEFGGELGELKDCGELDSELGGLGSCEICYGDTWR